MVDVEKRGLCTFEEYVLPSVDRLMNHERGIGDVWERSLGKGVQEHADLVSQRFRFLIRESELRRFVADDVVELLTEELGMPQIADAQTSARDLVRVGRSDSAARRPDPSRAELLLLGLLLEPMVRKDELRAVADEEVLADRYAEIPQHRHFAHEGVGVNDATVADDRGHAFVKNAGRNDVKDELLVADDDGVARVVASAVADHHVDTPSEEVNVLPFPLVAPLGADDHQARHIVSLSRERKAISLTKGGDVHTGRDRL